MHAPHLFAIRRCRVPASGRCNASRRILLPVEHQPGLRGPRRSLAAHVQQLSGLPVLRIHWYDSGENGRTDEAQQGSALLPKVKLRLRRIGFEGQQKGVDVGIGLDLVAHAP